MSKIYFFFSNKEVIKLQHTLPTKPQTLVGASNAHLIKIKLNDIVGSVLE